MNIHYIQHVPFEDLANIERWVTEHNHTLSVTHIYKNQDLPDIDDIDLLIILGGPMNIYEETDYPWIRTEKQFIKEAMKADKLILGICLGAQLLADALGARVYKNENKEIGWFPLRKITKSEFFRDFPEDFTAFHWHGDTFELPVNSELIATSKACQNQGFIYDDRVIGLQFHIETTQSSVQKLINNCSNDFVDGKYVQTPDDMLKYDGYNQIEKYLFSLLNVIGEKYEKTNHRR